MKPWRRQLFLFPNWLCRTIFTSKNFLIRLSRYKPRWLLLFLMDLLPSIFLTYIFRECISRQLKIQQWRNHHLWNMVYLLILFIINKYLGNLYLKWLYQFTIMLYFKNYTICPQNQLLHTLKDFLFLNLNLYHLDIY
jgi:hypothetical protein